jgi:hypothetical protein
MSKKNKAKKHELPPGAQVLTQELLNQAGYPPYPSAAYVAPEAPEAPFCPGTRVQVLIDNDATVAEVMYYNFGSGFDLSATGSSKRERGDKHDAVTAEALALARAYEKLSARLFRLARKRVRSADVERTKVHRPLSEWRRIQWETSKEAVEADEASALNEWLTEKLDATEKLRLKVPAEKIEPGHVGPVSWKPWPAQDEQRGSGDVFDNLTVGTESIKEGEVAVVPEGGTECIPLWGGDYILITETHVERYDSTGKLVMGWCRARQVSDLSHTLSRRLLPIAGGYSRWTS